MAKNIEQEKFKSPEGFEQARTIKPPPPARRKNQPVAQENPSERDQKIQEARAELAEKELVAKVLAEAGVHMHAWFPKESLKRLDGYNDLFSGRIKFSGGVILSPEGELKKQLKVPLTSVGITPEMKAHGINEFIDIRHLKTAEYETITIPGKKGFLGFGREPAKTEKMATGRYENIPHNRLVANGKNEPAVQILYMATGENYRDAGTPGTGSRGNKLFQMEFILPESTAKELEQALDSNPALIRNLSETAGQNLMRGDSTWDTPVPGRGGDPIRPPWEKWDSQPGGSKVYIQKEGGAPGWHEECVRTAKK